MKKSLVAWKYFHFFMTTKSDRSHYTINMSVSALKLLFQIVLVVSTSALVSGRCSTAEIHSAITNDCLSGNMIEQGTDPLVPVLNNSASVVNFCIRHISDIKNCITNVISACTSDKRVKVIFGTTGAALLAAYDGICKEPNKNIDLTCAFDYAENISLAVHELIHNVDSMDQQSASFIDLCNPVHTLLENITKIYEDAVEHGHCSEESKNVMHQYLSTIVFPCNDVATTYYPCTLAQINVDAIDCYAKNGVFVRNALVPKPDSMSNADEMCGFKSAIQTCLKNIITKCLYEPQVTTLYGSAVEGFEAAFNCFCSLENSDRIISCGDTVDLTSAMTQFTSAVHDHSIMGALDKGTQCALENTMMSQIIVALDQSCEKEMMAPWRVFLNTVIYPCTEKATICYPRNMYNGGEPTEAMRMLLLSFIGFIMFLFKYL